MLLVEVTIAILAMLVCIPILVFSVECFLSLLPHQSPTVELERDRPIVAVLVPAHNEAVEIGNMLAILKLDLQPEDRLVVIADNCDDDTAQVAYSSGATVLERFDLDHRGKGYALDYGLRYLSQNPPQAVIIIDADTHVHPGTIDRLARLTVSHKRPVQATNLLAANPERAKSQITAFGFMVKNLVRSRGTARLGLPCFLHGTGMAFPWELVDRASFASGNIVEDMQLGLDLSIAGYPPLFCAEGKVTGVLPQQEQAAKSQKTRWEHGHLQTLVTQGPRLLTAAIRQRRLDLFSMALDLCVPPLSLLVTLWLGATAAVGLLSVTLAIHPLAFDLLIGAGAILVAAILLAWAKFGRNELPLTTLLSVPMYILWKVPIYIAFLLRPQMEWVRTDRTR
jgi:cellulose synthase/poly-beta-1,6-N-acetylglucosamine synthase-like glycosyltransferase